VGRTRGGGSPVGGGEQRFGGIRWGVGRNWPACGGWRR